MADDKVTFESKKDLVEFLEEWDKSRRSKSPEAPPTPQAPPQTGLLAGSPGGEPPAAHNFKPWAKKCLGGCGEDNPDYAKPNVFCRDCGTPMGTLKKDEAPGSGEVKDFQNIKPCDGCGSTNGMVRENG